MDTAATLPDQDVELPTGRRGTRPDASVTTLVRPVEHALGHLDLLESLAIFIIREVAAESERPVLLFSGGKDSAVLLHLGTLGNLRTQTARAYDAAEMQKILSLLPK